MVFLLTQLKPESYRGCMYMYMYIQHIYMYIQHITKLNNNYRKYRIIRKYVQYIQSTVHALPDFQRLLYSFKELELIVFDSVQFVDPIGSSCLLPTSFSGGSSWLDSPLISNFRSVAVISDGSVCCGDPSFKSNRSWSCLIFARLWR